MMSDFESRDSYNKNRQLIPTEDKMAASYTEIAFQSSNRIINPQVHHDHGSPTNRNSDLLETNDGSSQLSDDRCIVDRLNRKNGFELSKNDDKKPQKRPATLLCDKSFPYDLEGTVRREGDMTHFVAENLEYKIKLSSPIAKRGINNETRTLINSLFNTDSSLQIASKSDLNMNQLNFSSKNSTPSTSAGIIQKHFLQSQLAQIDSNVLSDIEIDAQYLAASVDNLTENLYNLLHSVSSITADNVEIHKNSVNKLTDSMDSNIKCMYTIMAKTEEISKSMKPTEQLAMRIREIKRLVDMLENNL